MGKTNMNEVYKEMMRKLWGSDISQKDKEWLDFISDKEILKFSETVRVQDLYVQIFGKLPE